MRAVLLVCVATCVAAIVGGCRVSRTTDQVLTGQAHAHVGTARQVILDRFLSVSFIAALANDEKAGVAARLQTLIDTHPALAEHAEIRFPYRTEAYRGVRRD